MSGIDMIAAERKRQIEEKGWTAEHDDTHTHGEILRTSICYAVSAMTPDTTANGFNKAWQWDTVNGLWPFTCNTMHGSDIERLAKAGALIAAEIDRLQRNELRNTERILPVDPPRTDGKWREVS